MNEATKGTDAEGGQRTDPILNNLVIKISVIPCKTYVKWMGSIPDK